MSNAETQQRLAEDFRTNELHRALPNDTSTVLKARLAGTGAMALSDEETSEAYLAIKPLAKRCFGVFQAAVRLWISASVISTLIEHGKSPCYNEADHVSLFYAESWAIVHYLRNPCGVATKSDCAGVGRRQTSGCRRVRGPTNREGRNFWKSGYLTALLCGWRDDQPSIRIDG